jgi:hypothetical protein
MVGVAGSVTLQQGVGFEHGNHVFRAYFKHAFLKRQYRHRSRAKSNGRVGIWRSLDMGITLCRGFATPPARATLEKRLSGRRERHE